MTAVRQFLLDRTRLLGCLHGLSIIWPPAYDLQNHTGLRAKRMAGNPPKLYPLLKSQWLPREGELVFFRD